MCGEPYNKCTKEAFMAYLGLGNPAAPFEIYINLINDTSQPNTYYNQTTFSCNAPVISQYENATACGCLVKIKVL